MKSLQKKLMEIDYYKFIVCQISRTRKSAKSSISRTQRWVTSTSARTSAKKNKFKLKCK